MRSQDDVSKETVKARETSPATQVRVTPTSQAGTALHQPLIVLPDVGLWSNLYTGHITVLVQHMDVVVWGDADDGLFSCHGESQAPA